MQGVTFILISTILINSLPTYLSLYSSAAPTSGVSYDITSAVFNDPLVNCECNLTNTCLRKCCAANYTLQNTTCVLKPRKMEVSVYKNNEVIGDASGFSLISGLMPCAAESGYYKLDPKVFLEDQFFLQSDGRLWQPNWNTFVGYDQYCFENFDDEVSALVCFPKEVRMARRINAIGMIISMPFLLATFFVYVVLPHRNLHGTSLMCYVISLFLAYVLLVSIQMHATTLSDAACTTLGMFCLYFFMVSFFWMNVMSFDIWWKFSGLRGFSGSSKATKRKRFLLYSGYAWGVPLLLVIVVTCLSTAGSPDKWYSPGFGDGQCWLREGLPTLLYFYAPMAVLIIANIVLFAQTALKIKQVQQDTAILRRDESKKRSYESNKQRFNLYLKLLLGMGVNWSMEIISWAVDWQVGNVPPAVWYLTDFCNALYGVFIFFIFVCNRNIWNQLTKRYYMVMGKLHLARTIRPKTESGESARTAETSLGS